jgi:Ger(x)C family germination protein
MTVRRRAGPLVLAACVFSLTGCTQVLAVDQRALVTSLGIDAAKGGRVEVTTEWFTGANPATVADGGAGGGTARPVARSAIGANVGDALLGVQARSARRVDLSVTGSLLVGGAAARQDGRALFDYVFRDPEFPIEAYAAVAQPSARVILHAQVQGGVGYELFTHMRSTDSTFNGSLAMPVWRFLSDSVGRCEGAFLPMVASAPSGFRSSGTALFADGRMVGSLSPRQTAVLGYLLRQQPYADLLVPMRGRRHPMTLRIRSVQVRRGIDATGGSVRMNLVAEAREAEGVALTAPERKDLNALAAAAVLEELKGLLEHLKEQGVDITGLGRMACAEMPALASNWSHRFRTMPIEVSVHVHVTSEGRVT